MFGRFPNGWPTHLCDTDRPRGGTEGLRKIRFSGHKKARGKRGSERVCHVFSPEYGTVLLITVFGKNEQDDLTEVGKKAIANLIREIKVELEKGTF